MEKKTKFNILVGGGGVLLLIGITISLSYAFLSSSKIQDIANTFTSGCLNIKLINESNSITLNGVYPISDVEGLEGNGYTFSISNTCSTSTNYMINLESINQVANTLDTQYIKTSLSSDTMDNLIQKLDSNIETAKTLENAYKAHNLYKGTINGNSTKEFTLKLWMDYDTTKEQGASKTYQSKINVIANPDIEVTPTPEIKTTLADNTLNGVITGTATSVKYCASTSNICTPNTDTTINNNKVSIQASLSKGTNLTKEKVTELLGNAKISTDKSIVCTKLDNNKTYCTNPIEPVLEFLEEKGYRYEGKDVNNYVTFNNELWRIIGVFDTTVVDETDGTQKQEQLIKIIRDESIGDVQWNVIAPPTPDPDPVDPEVPLSNISLKYKAMLLSTTIENDWTTASLKTLLNEGDYYTRSGDYSSNGLTNDAKKMIENVVWNLGGSSTVESTADTFYSAERGSIGANGATDVSKIKWTGKVGLMYPSDYGYASPTSTCVRTTTLYDYDEGTTPGCSDNNWLFKDSYDQWTITPSSSYANYAFLVRNIGNLNNYNVNFGYGGSPSVYLKSGTKIVDGQGTQLEPYILGEL